jgi:hypothetical protein
MFRLRVMSAILFVALSGCGGADDDRDASTARQEGATTSAAPVTTAGRSPRCLDVPADLVEAIQTSLTKVEGVSTLRFAQAVKSNAFQRVYFISADVEGPGLEATDDVATWAKTGELVLGGGLTMSVPGLATEFSDLPDGSKTDADISRLDDGVLESKRCVREEAASEPDSSQPTALSPSEYDTLPRYPGSEECERTGGMMDKIGDQFVCVDPE